ncbi:MAG: O-antigen polysaccharide polymerase Wzy family protein [Bacillus cereus]|jgi:hypothetical protein|nr:O-antigen polysaccharide polymerase Wzy family protein [Bacillus cereus]
MKNTLSSKYFVDYLLIGCVGICFALLFVILNNQSLQYANESAFIVVIFLVMSIAYYISNKKEGWDILSPVHIYFWFYACIFIFTPIALILVGRTDCMGVDVMGGCYRATIAAMLSVIFFMIGYSKAKVAKEYKPIKELSMQNRKRSLKIAYLFFFLGLIVDLWVLRMQGRSLLYIFSLGYGDSYERLLGSHDINFEFVYNIHFAMMIPWLLICHFSQSKTLKIVLTFVMFTIFYAGGFRFIFYIMLLSYVIVYYRKKISRPQVSKILLVVLAVLVFSTFLGMQRGKLRTGEQLQMEATMDNNDIAYTLESNFNIYQPFYGVAEKYPMTYNYTLGRVMLGDAFILWIPRLVWPSKPRGDETNMSITMKNSINASVIDQAAMAMPNVAPFYVDWGYVGVILFSFLLGYALKKTLKLFYSGNMLYIITYGILCGILIQYINRGAFVLLTVLLVFFLLPVFFLKKYFK